MFKMMSEAGDNVKISPPTDARVKTKKNSNFLIFCPEEKEIVHMDQDKIEKCPTPVWNDIIYVTGEKNIGTEAARDKTTERVYEHARKPL